MKLRRAFLIRVPALLTVFALLSAGCSGAVATPSQIPPAEQTGALTVLEWAGFDAEDFWIDFRTTYPKVEVTFEIGESDANILSRMTAGDQADIVHPYTGWLHFYVEEGLVEEIDTTRLKNWDKVPEHFKQMGQFDGKQYFIPWDWGFSSILYRKDLVPEGVDSWSALMDPKYSGHIAMWDDGPQAVAVGSYIHGWDLTQLTPEQVSTIQQEWIEQREHNLFYWATEPEVVDAVASGDVWVAYAWQGAYATLLQQGVSVGYADPKEGRNSWVGAYGIRKGSPNYDLALKFLDAKLGEATGRSLVNLFYYGHANERVMQGITNPVLKEVFSTHDPSILEKTNFTPNLTNYQRESWTAMWAQVKSAPLTTGASSAIFP